MVSRGDYVLFETRTSLVFATLGFVLWIGTITLISRDPATNLASPAGRDCARALLVRLTPKFLGVKGLRFSLACQRTSTNGTSMALFP